MVAVSRKAKKYKRKETQNEIGPKDGSQPLTVVEFSLTNETRDALKKLLRSHALGEANDLAQRQLGGIIANPDYFPKEVLTELRRLYKDDNASTVYVIRNLPEFSMEEIPEDIKDRGHEERWLKKHGYINVIGRAIAAAVELKPDMVLDLNRSGRPKTVSGGSYLHKHTEPLVLLSIIKADGAPTRLTDLLAFSEDPRAKDITVTPDDRKAPFTLDKLSEVYPDWRQSKYLGLKPRGYSEQYDACLDAHSQLVVPEDRTIIVLPGRGRVMHQGMPSPADLPEGLNRIAFSRSLMEPGGRF
jgi:hypothetical protein